MAKHLVCISGSYRADGATEQALAALADEARQRGWTCERIRLDDIAINFCRNCRLCAQTPGQERGDCPLEDDVKSVLTSVDNCQALVLASPVNFFDVTAVTRAFLERLMVVGYWPWGKFAPSWRDRKPIRPSILITSTAMPGILARFFTRSMKSLKDMSGCLRARPVDRVFLGMVAREETGRLPEKAIRRVRRAAARLLK